MGKANSRSDATAARRSAILQAALTAFNSLGYEATTIEDIRARAQASTGSIYHHFTSKEQLAGELYITGLRDYQQGLLAVLAQARSAEAGVKAVVDYHLKWIAESRERARYLFFMRQAEFAAAAQTSIREMNREFFQALFGWLKPYIASGEIIKLPPDIFGAILVGPSQDFARHWLAGRVQTDIKQAGKQLAEAAWRALRNDQNSSDQANSNQAN